MNFKLMRIFFILFFLAGCSSSGLLTPFDSFKTVRKSILNKNGLVFQEAITQKSLFKIKSIVANLKLLNKTQKKSLADESRVPIKIINSINTYRYIRYFLMDKKYFLHKAFTQKIIKIETGKSKSIMVVQSGLNLIFRKVGPYWKLDISNY